MAYVSIVLPSYNGEKFIRQSISSIMNQTYSDWELILIDDGSEDSTAQIMEEYCSRDVRITCVHNGSNQKLPNSLNIGFSLACGEYLTWTSDDNVYRSDAIETMVRCLEKHPQYGMVYSDMGYMDADGRHIGCMHSRMQDLYLYNCIGACFLYKRECMEAVGGYSASRFLVEDYEYWIRISQKYQIYHIEDELYQYRFHDNSLSAIKMKEVGRQVLKMKVDYMDYIVEKLNDRDRLGLLFELSIYDHDTAERLQSRLASGTEKERYRWIFRKRSYEPDKKILLFGAGAIGMQAMYMLGKDKVYGYIDNNEAKTGTYIEHKKVFSLTEVKEIYKEYNIVISTDTRKAFFIAEQLEEMGIYHYKTFYELL